MSNMTLGSLFDGSGGFPLGGLLAGITPVWASEIEPFPIRVTTKRLPFMKHYGNVSEMDGGKVEPVDIITFGSPCQDMSVAGKRAGLEGSRSNLFYEAVRIIKEMRKATGGKYPRWACWENVPGAFSSSGGEDFRCVLESLCGVIDESVSIAKPKKWANAGEILGDGYSLAWRVIDAQFWGVPQRRKRIYLVADFTGGGAGKVLFESEGLSGYSPQGFRSWQATPGGSSDCSGAAGIGFDGYNGSVTNDKSATLGVNCGMSTGRNGVVLNDQGGNRMDVTEDVTCTLRAEAHHPPCVMEAAGFCTEHSAKARGIGYQEECSPTLRAGTVPATVYDNHSQDTRYTGPVEAVQPLSATMGLGGNNQPFVAEPITLKIRSGCEGGGKGPLIQEDKSATLSCNNDQTLFEPCLWNGEHIAPTLTTQNADGGQRMPDKDNFNCVLQPVTGPLLASGYNKLGTQEAANGMYVLQPFGICSKDSNAMKSSNPHSGVYAAETSRTLDTGGGNPACNQGGIAVVAIEGNGSRPSHRGDGYSEGDAMYTLNSVEQHAVAYSMTTGSFPNVAEEKTPPLLARDYKDATVVTEPSFGIGRDAFNQGANAQYKPCIEQEVQPTIVAKGPGAVAHPHGFYPQMKTECMCMTEETSGCLVNGTNPGFQNGVLEPGYTVRRLTPTECARLQGFPDWWCWDLGTEHPTDAEVYDWYKVFKTYAEIIGGKPKTDKQLRSWLKDPYSDSAEYKMWGNGVALPCVFFVLSGIVWATKKETAEAAS